MATSGARTDIEVQTNLLFAIVIFLPTVRILILEQLGIERHTVLQLRQCDRGHPAALIDHRPLPQNQWIFGKDHGEAAGAPRCPWGANADGPAGRQWRRIAASCIATVRPARGSR